MLLNNYPFFTAGCRKKKKQPELTRKFQEAVVAKRVEDVVVFTVGHNRTYGLHKNLYVYLFLLAIFGPIYYGPLSR